VRACALTTAICHRALAARLPSLLAADDVPRDAPHDDGGGVAPPLPAWLRAAARGGADDGVDGFDGAAADGCAVALRALRLIADNDGDICDASAGSKAPARLRAALCCVDKLVGAELAARRWLLDEQRRRRPRSAAPPLPSPAARVGPPMVFAALSEAVGEVDRAVVQCMEPILMKCKDMVKLLKVKVRCVRFERTVAFRLDAAR